MHKVFKRSFFFLFILIYTTVTQASQLDFKPVVSNFSQTEYHGGLQNWAVAQDKNGTMFFGNNKGLLSFDGYRWALYPLPSNSIVRAILPDGDRVYVGTYTDFGYFQHDINGQYKYTSLWPIKYQPHNDEIWKIIKAPNGHIYFQSFCSWFDYNGKTVTAHYNPAQLPLYFFPISNRQIYVQMMNGGLALLRNNQYKQILPRSVFANDDIVGITEISQQKLILATAKNGLYTLENGTVTPRTTAIDTEIKQNQINKISLLNPTTMVIGTIRNGVYAIDVNTGKLLWHYNMENNLKNNTVLALTTDKSGNVWVALDNGISLIHTALPLHVMRTDQLQQPIGMVYGMGIQYPHMYIATNQALWRYNLNNQQMERMSNTGGQNWHIFNANNQLFAGHNLSTWKVNGTQISPITEKQGGSTCMKMYRMGNEDIIIEAGYNDLNVYKLKNNEWVWSHTIQGFQAPIMAFEIDNNGIIWASHFSKGIYQIELSKDLQRVTRQQYHTALSKEGVQSQIKVMKIRNRVVFSYQGKLYTYDDLKRTIVPYNELDKIITPLSLIAATSVDNETFWVSNEQAFININYENGQYHKKAYIPYKAFGLEVNTNGGAMYTEHNRTYFFLNNGVGLYYNEPSKQQKFPLIVAEATTTNNNHQTDTLPTQPKAEPKIKSDNIQIVLSYPNFNHQQLTFAVTLEGDGKIIRLQQETPQFTFHNLGYGTYQLKAIVTDSSGKTLAETQYNFQHPTPFYLSIWAIIIYIFIAYMLLRTYTSWRTNKLLQEKKLKAEKELMEQNLQMLEQKHIIARQQQIIMENELTNKSKELASMALQIATHSSKAETLRDELLEKKRKGQLSVKDFEKLIANVDSNDDTEMWNVFQQNFDLIHKNFFRNLRQRYPDLTPTDLKFCALLRLNYNTKDIVKFTRLTVRGVEGARYRLRKKLGIKNEQSLTDFLIELE